MSPPFQGIDQFGPPMIIHFRVQYYVENGRLIRWGAPPAPLVVGTPPGASGWWGSTQGYPWLRHRSLGLHSLGMLWDAVGC